MKHLEPMKLCHELLKLKPTGPLLGLTLGSRCVGLALSDDSRKFASPFTILVRTKVSIDTVASRFQNLISRRSISGLVIGYPFDAKKKRPYAGVNVERFVDDLSKTGKLEDMNYTFWEGDYTTKKLFQKAKRELLPEKLYPKHPDTIKDEFAAFEILQAYMDFVNAYYKHETFPGQER